MSAISVFHGQNIVEGRKNTPENARSTPMAANGWSQTWTYYEGDWHEGNIGIVGPRTHAMWLGSSVFDGARPVEGGTPEPHMHCARGNDSPPKPFLKGPELTENLLGPGADRMK